MAIFTPKSAKKVNVEILDPFLDNLSLCDHENFTGIHIADYWADMPNLKAKWMPEMHSSRFPLVVSVGPF